MYKIWVAMKQRCFNPKDKAFRNYGGRGITVCDSWAKSFPAFVQDMGERPEGFTLDRIDNNGPYTGPCVEYPQGNCRWASRTDQMLNARSTCKRVIQGVEYKVAVLAKISGLSPSTIRRRATLFTKLKDIVNPMRPFYQPQYRIRRPVPHKEGTKTHCKQGHEYTEANSYWDQRTGYRQCRACREYRDKTKRRQKP